VEFVLTPMGFVVIQVVGIGWMKSIAVFWIVLMFPSSPWCSSLGIVGLVRCVFQVKHADIWTRFRVTVSPRSVAVEDGRKGYRDMRRTFQTWLAVTFAEDTDLSDKVERLGRGCRHATSENALFI
jgi:hypothetical protein